MIKIFLHKQFGKALLLGLMFFSLSCDGPKEKVGDSGGDTSGGKVTQDVDQDWPLFRRDAEMQGVSLEDLKAPLKLVWEFLPPDLVAKSEEGAAGKKVTKKRKRGYPIQATAVIVDGLVYVGSQEGRFFCLDLKDGKMKWEFKSEGLISGPAAVIGDKVVFGCQYGFLYALDRKSGEQLWRFEADDKIEGGVNALAMKNPATGKDQTRLFFGSYDNHLYAVDAKTGELIWKYETDNYLVATPSVVGGDDPSVI
ncbi:MAG: PQQ-like beta-propeller repeat protein, partial [Verrucomicrobia bacterium]|nr:PQQ-like beta-propeller repeat protein [Verrucomicrobiota bacterium]